MSKSACHAGSRLWVCSTKSLSSTRHRIHAYCPVWNLPSLLCVLHSIVSDNHRARKHQKQLFWGVTGRLGKPWMSQSSPSHSLTWALPSVTCTSFTPVLTERAHLYLLFLLLRTYSPFILGVKEGFYLTWSLLFCDQLWGCTFRETNVLGFGVVFLTLCSKQLCYKP